ncbi:MAG: hypothetical protein WA771_12245 [Chthoniobacterales bacterium]
MWTLLESLFDSLCIFDWGHRPSKTRLGESELDRKSRQFTDTIFAVIVVVGGLGGAIYWFFG